jgi:anti-anti-sigma factor
MAHVRPQIAIEEHSDAQDELVVRVRGELDLSNVEELASSIDQAEQQGVKQLVVDLMECEFIDSAGLAVILRGAKRLDEAGGRLSVACGHPEIRRLLALTAIDQTVAVLDSVPQLPRS